MTEADAEDRRRRPEAADEVDGDARLAWSAGAGRQDDVARRERGDLVERELVVAPDDRLAAELAHVAGEVVHERIVVIDDENHLSYRCRD